MKRRRFPISWRTFLLCLALAVQIGILFRVYLDLKQYRQNTRQVQQAELARYAIESLMSDLAEAETGQRGYLLTGQESYLQPYHAATARIPAGQKQLAGLIADPQRRPVVSRIGELSSVKLAELDQTIQLAQTGRRAAALQIVESGRGQRSMDEIRGLLGRLKTDADAVALQESRQTEGQATRTLAVLVAGQLLVAVFLIGATVVIERDFQLRDSAEKRIRRSEQRFRSLVSAGSQLTWVGDPEGKTLEAPPQWGELTGQSPLSGGGYEWSAAIHPEDRAAVTEAWLRSVKEKVPWELECRVLLRDGSYRYFFVRCVPVFEHDGRVREWIVAANDIHDRKSAEQTQSHLASIVESSNDAIISTGLDAVVLSWNPAAEKLYGYPSSEAIGRHISFVTVPGSESELEEITGRILRGERVINLETKRVRKDGSIIEVSVTVSPIRDAAGKIIGASAIARDVTGRRQAEQARSYLASIIDSSNEAIVGKTLDGIIESWNLGAERLYGYAAEEVIGKPISILIPPGDADELPGILDKLSKGEKIDQYETKRQRKDGSFVEVSVTISPVRDAQGHIIGASAIARDITERKQAERERAELLAREQAARAEAEAASQLKDEFLATVSHELRTPLTSILGWARMLQSGALGAAEQQQGLAVIERNARAQTSLIEDILESSRIITGKLRLDVRPLELHGIISAAVDGLGPAAEAKGIRIQKVLDPNAGLVLGDPERLQQVMWNLLSNAIKFTPKGGRVQIGLQRINSHVEITVSDTGTGIKPEFLPHVFERFRQADTSTRRAHGGLGLGLAIGRHLIELHGGTIRADSPGEGHGATFTVRLPILPVSYVKRDDLAPPAQSPLGDTGAFQPGPVLAGLRILIVDDEPDALQLLSTVLGQCGADVVSATSAQKALAEIQESRPELLISDIGMPGEDGFALIKRVRELERVKKWPLIPAVALTAYARRDDRLGAFQAGYQVHLSKPVDLKELIAVASSLTTARHRVDRGRS